MTNTDVLEAMDARIARLNDDAKACLLMAERLRRYVAWGDANGDIECDPAVEDTIRGLNRAHRFITREAREVRDQLTAIDDRPDAIAQALSRGES